MASHSSTRRRTGPQRTRLIARSVHLVAAAALGTFVYAPAEYVEPVRLLLQLLVVPLASLTGVLLWKQAQVRRLLTRTRTTRGPIR